MRTNNRSTEKSLLLMNDGRVRDIKYIRLRVQGQKKKTMIVMSALVFS